MKQIVFSLFLLLACSSAFSQIYKGQWLVGGSGNFSLQKTPDRYVYQDKQQSLSLSPDAGYFIINNLAVGVRPGYTLTHSKTRSYDSSTITSNSHTFSAAPFVRYYVLPATHKINVLAEGSYGWDWGRYKSYNSGYKFSSSYYSFSAGPVLFINSSVALELTGNYQHYIHDFYSARFFINAGFQVHLGKARLQKKS